MLAKIEWKRLSRYDLRQETFLFFQSLNSVKIRQPRPQGVRHPGGGGGGVLP